jgi:hypothetical protein
MPIIKRPIIGVAGRATSGKSFAALTLKSNGWKIRAFADPIKQSLAAMGLTNEHLYGSEKELPCEILGGKSPRFAMQQLGDWGRELFGVDFYVRIMRRKLIEMTVDTRVVIEDVRYQNEVDLIHSFGGQVVLIQREGADASPVDHSSEALNFNFDIAVSNNSTTKHFMDAISAIGEAIFDGYQDAAE